MSGRDTICQARALLPDLYRTAEQEFGTLGMRKHCDGQYSKHLNADAIATIALNIGDRYGIDVNPIVGVVFEPVESLFAELYGLARQVGDLPATISSPIGYQMPVRSFRTWRIASLQEIAPKIRDIKSQVQRYGVPLMERHTDLESILTAFAAAEQRFDRATRLKASFIGGVFRSVASRLGVYQRPPQGLPSVTHDDLRYRKPVALHLSGRRDEARQILLRGLEGMDSVSGQHVEGYRRFARGLLEKIDESANSPSKEGIGVSPQE